MNYVDSFNLFGVEAKQIPSIKGSGAPTTSTEGAVGCLYMDTGTGDVYKCTSATDGVYTWKYLGGTPEALTYLEQSLTDDQKAQARENIGAASDNILQGIQSSNLLNTDTMTRGMGMDASGGTYTSGYENYILTDYIPVTSGDVIVCQANGLGESTAAIRYMRFVTAFNGDKTILADKGSNTNATSYIVPDGVSFVRVSIPSTNYYQADTIMVHKGEGVLPYEPYYEPKKLLKLNPEAHDEEYIKGLIAEENSKEDSVFEYCMSSNLLNTETMTVGKGMSADGTEYSGENFVLTDYIPVSAGDVITYQARSKGSTSRWIPDMRFVCCFDENKTILSSLGANANVKSFTVPEGVFYIRVTGTNYTYLLDHAITKSEKPIPYEPYYNVKTLKAESLPKNSRRLALPSTIYGFANQPVSIYFRNIMDYHPNDVYVMVTSSSVNDGKLHSDRWTYTPTEEATKNVELRVYDHDYTMKNGELFKLDVKATSTKSNLTALVIGDSTVNAGLETQKMLDLATADGYDLTLLGTRGSGANQHEGRSGWTAGLYISVASYGNVANPFYNPDTAAFDFDYYMTQQGYSSVDCVFLQLGINDMFAAQSDDEMTVALNTYLSNMETIINSIHAYDANIKVIVNLMIPCSADQDAFGNTYNIQTAIWRCKKNTYEANLALIDKYDGATNIYLSPYNAALDTVNNMDGGVHPVQAGYDQLGTQMYSYLRAIN